MSISSVTKWLFATENPFKLWGFFPTLIWLIPMIVIVGVFAFQETLGVKRVHGMVPLTWIWRCAPRIIWFVAAGLSIWHFAVVSTRVPR